MEPSLFLAHTLSHTDAVLSNTTVLTDDTDSNVSTAGGGSHETHLHTNLYQVSLDGFVLEVVVVAVLIVVCMGVLCVRRGWVGPPRLKPGDLRALTTLSDTYRIAQLELDADVLGYETDTWCYVGQLPLATSPVENWSEMFSSAPRGFLVELAKGIDMEMLAFQHRVWLAKGDFCAHLPTVLVAQEWRRWAMEDLQMALSPDAVHKEAIRRRLKWIDDVRDLSLLGVSQLRETQCWDDSDDRSLLVTLRSRIHPELRKYYNNWSVFEMLQDFSVGAGDVVSFCTQLLRNSIRFSEKVFCTHELRLTNLQGNAKDQKLAVDRQILQFAEHAGLFNSSFPESFRAKFLAPDELEKLEKEVAGSVRKPPSTYRTVVTSPQDMLEEEKQKVKDLQKNYRSWQFGLQKNEQEFVEMLRHYVVMMEHSYVLLDVILLLVSIENFARLGGANLLSDVVDKAHGQSVLSFAKDEVSEVKQNLVHIADIAQGGWSNLRRKTQDSPWSNRSPLDNLRMAINLMETVERIFENTVQTLQVLKGKISKARAGGDPSKELSAEVKFYHRFWEIMVRKHKLPHDDVDFI
mmetsp:Transcript_40829/g.94716  ORF Transcript_40829/g.94716 Transcript_40829/m.94716 type:complete len:575 (+) Transcript_40829:102-1826(+)